MIYRLPLHDPLWRKLDSAQRDEDIADAISDLSEQWDSDEADGLFWDNLCHQETLYGATYAAVPWFLEMAMSSQDVTQINEIAQFLVAVTIFSLRDREDAALPGLPDTLEGWDRKLDPYRTLAKGDPGNRRWQTVLETGAVGPEELTRISEVREAFLALVPEIGAFCEARLAHAGEEDERRVYLAGAAAALGYTHFSEALLLQGDEGVLQCRNCGEYIEFARFDESVAYYPPRPDGPTGVADNPMLEDWKDGRSSRQQGLLEPASTIADEHLSKILATLPEGQTRILAFAFLGRFICPSCGVENRGAARETAIEIKSTS